MYHFLTATFNRHKLTFNSVNDIVNQMSELNKEFRIVVVEAGDINKLKEKFKEDKFHMVEIIDVPDDTYWTTAMNIGTNKLLENSAEDDIFIFFNNDTRIPPKTINSFNKYDFQKNIAVSPISISTNDNKSVSTGVKVISWPLCIHRAKYINLSEENLSASKEVEVDFMTQRFLICGSHVIRKIGNYNSDFFRHYGGDYELTSRMVKNGFKLILNPAIHVYIDEMDTGLNSRYRKLSFTQRIQSLYDIKSSSNLWVAAKFSYMVAPWWSQPLNMLFMILKALIRAVILKPRA